MPPPRIADTGPCRCPTPGRPTLLGLGGHQIAQLATIALFCLLSGAALARPQVDRGTEEFYSRCTAITVLVCLPLDSAAEIDRYRSTPKYIDPANWIQWDPLKHAARFTIPTHSGPDSSGMLHIPFPQHLINTYVSFDVRYPGDFLKYRFKGDGWKTFILGQGDEGCAPYEVVGGNAYYKGHPFFYYLCGVFAAIAKQSPYGDNLSEFDFQPGGETECVRRRRPQSRPCARFVPDAWVTYQVHVDSRERHLEVWQTVRGETMKIIDFPLSLLPAKPAAYEWIKLTPFNTNKDAAEDHPKFHIWYRRVIVSTAPIPFPLAESVTGHSGSSGAPARP